MAQKVHIVLEDDLDGTVTTQAIKFSVGGAAYEIDLNDKNADELHKALAPFVGGASRKTGRPTSSTRRTPSVGGSAAEIRVWVSSNGMTVPARGRIPADVRPAYDAAH